MKPIDEDIDGEVNSQNLLKYCIMFAAVYIASITIPNCTVFKKQSMQIALVGVTTFAILDVCFPQYITV